MFGGTYEHNLDKAWRLSFPSKFKSELQGGVVITAGLDGCLWAFTQSRWEEEVQTLNNAKNTKDSRAIKRYFIGNAYDLVPDKNLRITLPQLLREKIKLEEKAVVLIGVGDRFEIWRAGTYQAKQAELENDEISMEEHYENHLNSELS